MHTLVRSSCGSSSGDESRAARRAPWSYIDRRRHMPSPEPRASTPPTSSASLAAALAPTRHPRHRLQDRRHAQ
eukprot:scaffold77625_cov38-Phaeocystis_antarctica.AAC.1